jgi:hypothetical protein
MLWYFVKMYNSELLRCVLSPIVSEIMRTPSFLIESFMQTANKKQSKMQDGACSKHDGEQKARCMLACARQRCY